MEENNELFKYTPIIDNPTSWENISQYYADNNLIASNPLMDAFLNQKQNQITETSTGDTPKRATVEDIVNNYTLPEFLRRAEEARKLTQQSKENRNTSRRTYSTSSPATSKQARAIISEIKGMDINDEDKEYLVKLANRESSYNPTIINRFGYEGLYQFGDDALKTVGMTRQNLRSGTLNQHTAALRLAEANERTLWNLASQYIGKDYRGVKVTKNGIRAAAHLLGAGSVQDWFRGTTKSKIAKKGFVDGNGTHITEYFRMFA